MKRTLLYFGCMNHSGQKGHYLYETDTSKVGCGGAMSLTSYFRRHYDIQANGRVLECLDGVYTPAFTSEQGIYQVSIVPPFMIVAWHDYTGDARGGSNSVLIGTGYDNAETMIDDAIGRFPTIMKRQNRPIPNPQPTQQ